MYKQKLCLGLSRQFSISKEEQIKLFKKVGFDGFFCEVCPEDDLIKLKETADEYEMLFQSVHAPYQNVRSLWYEDEKTQTTLKELTECIEQTAKAGVQLLVMHTFIGFEEHSPTPSGIVYFKKLVKKAEECGVKLAFENTEGEEYLFAVMQEFKDNPFVGFCWDTGHEQCYNRGKDMLALYGDRLLCTHLNDNLGVKDYGGKITYIDDLHLLPFDGIINWENTAKRLNDCNFDKELTFELNIVSKPGRCENDKYAKLPLAEYLTEAYARACKIAYLKSVMR